MSEPISPEDRLDLGVSEPDFAAEAAWRHAEKHHASQDVANESLIADYLRALVAELRAARYRT